LIYGSYRGHSHKNRHRGVRILATAVDQSIVRHISVQECREAIASGEIIEDYPMINMVQVAYSLA